MRPHRDRRQPGSGSAAILLVTLTALIGGIASGQTPDELSSDSSLADLLTFAAEHNPGLAASESRWRAARAAASVARRLPDPRISYGHYLESVETRVGPQRRRFSLSQTIPWLPRLRLRGKIADHAAVVLHEHHLADRQELFFRVKEAYHEYGYLERSLAVAIETVTLIEQFEGVVRARQASGGSQVATLGVQLELERMRDRLTRLREEQHTAAARLNALLGRSPNSPLPHPVRPVMVAESAPLAQLQADLRDGNPALRASLSQVNRESAAERLAGQSYYPDLTLGIQYIDTDEALDPDLAGSGQDPLIASLTLNLPLWFGRHQATREEAGFRRAAAEAAGRDLENRLVADLEEALFDLRDARRRADLYETELIPLATQAREVTLRAFSAGSAGYGNLMEAERGLLEMKLATERALADWGIGRARVELLIGRELE